MAERGQRKFCRTVQPVLPKGLCLHPHDCTKQRGCGGHLAAHLSECLAKP